MTPQPVNYATIARASVYMEVLQKYRYLSPDRMVPAAAIRLRCLHVGYDEALARFAAAPIAASVEETAGEILEFLRFMKETMEVMPPPDEIRAGVDKDLALIAKEVEAEALSEKIATRVKRLVAREANQKLNTTAGHA
jgi:hypothetical protein